MEKTTTKTMRERKEGKKVEEEKENGSSTVTE